MADVITIPTAAPEPVKNRHRGSYPRAIPYVPEVLREKREKAEAAKQPVQPTQMSIREELVFTQALFKVVQKNIEALIARLPADSE